MVNNSADSRPGLPALSVIAFFSGGRVARQSEFSFCGLTSAIQKRLRFRRSLSTGQRVFVRQGLPRAGLNHFFLAPPIFYRTPRFYYLCLPPCKKGKNDYNLSQV